MTNTVHSLRQSGHKVRVIHQRYYSPNNLNVKVLLSKREVHQLSNEHNQFVMLPHGGATLVEITTPSGQNVNGISSCSIKDGFNRKLGLKIAINRALAKLNKS